MEEVRCAIEAFAPTIRARHCEWLGQVSIDIAADCWAGFEKHGRGFVEVQLPEFENITGKFDYATRYVSAHSVSTEYPCQDICRMCREYTPSMDGVVMFTYVQNDGEIATAHSLRFVAPVTPPEAYEIRRNHKTRVNQDVLQSRSSREGMADPPLVEQSSVPTQSWSIARQDFLRIFEWWHGRNGYAVGSALTFAEECWTAARLDSRGANQADCDGERRLATLAISFLWRGFLVDFGRTSPGHTDGWTDIAEWIGFDAFEHFSTEDPKVCQNALVHELACRSLLVAHTLGEVRLRDLLRPFALAHSFSLDNLIAVMFIEQTVFDVPPLIHAQFDAERLISLSARREQVLDYLVRIPCPYRLDPLCLRTMDIALQRPIYAQIESGIFVPLRLMEGLREQFIRDFKVYGLLEAIVFLGVGMQEMGGIDPELLRSACNLYHLTAYLYLANHFRMFASNDPRLAARLNLLGNSQHSMPGLRMKPLVPIDSIKAVSQPKRSKNYVRRMPLPEMVVDMPFLGNDSGEPQSFPDELVEHLTLGLHRGFDILTVFFEVAHALREHDIDPFGGDGQYVLRGVAAAVNYEIEHCDAPFATCAQCALPIKPKYRLPTINQVLQLGRFVCTKCLDAPPIRDTP